jgi:carboxymethylenebutenolidase
MARSLTQEPAGNNAIDPGALFDEHMRAEFQTRDLDATMATMVDEPLVLHVPTGTGGVGPDEVRRFYGHHFIGQWPADLAVKTISRTVGQGRVVDELVLTFTHDVEMDAIAPGLRPTGRSVEMPFVVIVGVEGEKIAYEHIYWDQASLLVQLGLIKEGTLPVLGAEEARLLLDPTQPRNRLIPT